MVTSPASAMVSASDTTSQGPSAEPTTAELVADRDVYSPGGSSATPFDPDLSAYGYAGD